MANFIEIGAVVWTKHGRESEILSYFNISMYKGTLILPIEFFDLDVSLYKICFESAYLVF